MKTIIVIDDVADLVESVVMLLELEGFRVFGEVDGPSGIARAVEKSADLVVLDFLMPRMNGAEIAKALRAHPALPRLKILMCSATPEPIVRRSFAGYDGFLVKPAFPQALLAAIHALLADA